MLKKVTSYKTELKINAVNSRRHLRQQRLLESHNNSRCQQRNQLRTVQSQGSELRLVSPLEIQTAPSHGRRLRTRLRLLLTRTVVSGVFMLQGRSWVLTLFADRQIPSILSYVDGEEYNGQQAKQQLVRNSKNTVAYFRDFLGQE